MTQARAHLSRESYAQLVGVTPQVILRCENGTFSSIPPKVADFIAAAATNPEHRRILVGPEAPPTSLYAPVAEELHAAYRLWKRRTRAWNLPGHLVRIWGAPPLSLKQLAAEGAYSFLTGLPTHGLAPVSPFEFRYRTCPSTLPAPDTRTPGGKKTHAGPERDPGSLSAFAKLFLIDPDRWLRLESDSKIQASNTKRRAFFLEALEDAGVPTYDQLIRWPLP